MPRTTRQTIVLTLCAGAAALLAACGSGTKTVTKASAPPLTQSTATQTQPSATQKTGAQTTPTQTTQTSTAFTQNESKTEGLSAASAALRAKGFTPRNTSDYHSDQALRVLVGTRTGSGDGYGQQAFFFVNGRYIGTDTKDTSATVKVLSQSDTEVTLGYPLYRT
jgi:hypothetical protein